MSTSLKIDAELKERIQNLATVRQRSASWIMKEAITQYVNREEARESFAREAMESWEHYKETGLHITLDELSAWLNTVGTDAETDPPQCHT